MPAPIPSHAPLRDLLERRRLDRRDRRLAHVIDAMRAREDAAGMPPRSLLDAISSAHERLHERLAEIDRDTRPSAGSDA